MTKSCLSLLKNYLGAGENTIKGIPRRLGDPSETEVVPHLRRVQGRHRLK